MKITNIADMVFLFCLHIYIYIYIYTCVKSRQMDFVLRKKGARAFFKYQEGLNKKEIQLNLSNIFSIFIFDELYLFD